MIYQLARYLKNKHKDRFSVVDHSTLPSMLITVIYVNYITIAAWHLVALVNQTFPQTVLNFKTLPYVFVKKKNVWPEFQRIIRRNA